MSFLSPYHFASPFKHFILILVLFHYPLTFTIIIVGEDDVRCGGQGPAADLLSSGLGKYSRPRPGPSGVQCSRFSLTDWAGIAKSPHNGGIY